TDFSGTSTEKDGTGTDFSGTGTEKDGTGTDFSGTGTEKDGTGTDFSGTGTEKDGNRSAEGRKVGRYEGNKSLVGQADASHDDAHKSFDSISQKNTSGQDLMIKAAEVVDFLNSKTGKNFQATNKSGKATKSVYQILNRLRDGYTVQDMKTVTARKIRESRDGKFEEAYLRPETLYGPLFETYLGQCVLPPEDGHE
ncbi:MAG: conserved phage C-terminal domain-containing protein, partial [Magnetococcales bacterium]|nr:conserved phage C-terminal domain-containing protein [Magnetococcales bacterium]